MKVEGTSRRAIGLEGGAHDGASLKESAPAEPRRALEELVDHEGALCIPVLGTFMRDTVKAWVTSKVSTAWAAAS